MKYSMYHVLAAGLVVGQTLILSLSPACSAEVSENKTSDTVSISTKESTQTNTNLSTKNNTSASDNEKVVTAEANSATSSVINQPSTRIPIYSRIFIHPSMQQ